MYVELDATPVNETYVRICISINFRHGPSQIILSWELHFCWLNSDPGYHCLSMSMLTNALHKIESKKRPDENLAQWQIIKPGPPVAITLSKIHCDHDFVPKFRWARRPIQCWLLAQQTSFENIGQSIDAVRVKCLVAWALAGLRVIWSKPNTGGGGNNGGIHQCFGPGRAKEFVQYSSRLPHSVCGQSQTPGVAIKILNQNHNVLNMRWVCACEWTVPFQPATRLSTLSSRPTWRYACDWMLPPLPHQSHPTNPTHFTHLTYPTHRTATASLPTPERINWM